MFVYLCVCVLTSLPHSAMGWFAIYDCNSTWSTPGRRQSKTLIPSTNADQKSLETEYLIAICRPIENTYLAIIDPRSSIVKSVFDCRGHTHLMSLVK